MNWNEFLDAMQGWGIARLDPKSFAPLDYATQVKPRQYLDFANKDLLLATDHGYVNALSNAKRAIDCQIFNLLSILGLRVAGNIHKRIERIEGVSILAPRILKKVNKIRNLLEHEFQKPSVDEAEDAVDIATLFVEATDKVFVNFMDSFWIAREGSENRPAVIKENGRTIFIDDELPKFTFADGLYIEYDTKTRDYGIWGFLGNEEVLEAEVKRGSPLHIELLRLSILNHHTNLEYEDDVAANEFVGRVRGKDGISL